MKKIADILRADGSHWVGDGFPVRSLFSYHHDSEAVSPFLLFDYAGPHRFNPTDTPRGVGQHPHRGFETVTIVYDGEVAHRDSAGHGGIIGPGDVQWMTAARGIIHEEFHSPNYSKIGGPFRMVQLWVNLPAKDKMSPSGYQAITSVNIPVVSFAGGTARIIAGTLRGTHGPASRPSSLSDRVSSSGLRCSVIFNIFVGRLSVRSPASSQYRNRDHRYHVQQKKNDQPHDAPLSIALRSPRSLLNSFPLATTAQSSILQNNRIDDFSALHTTSNRKIAVGCSG